ncbi:MAG TPA: DNA-3-methyladenine glycosylase [Symbiobacteriaceae bacterium]|nr:DNA-3-methyladenine glycosylase [Symbiobacteriaceae bacterium]
MHKLTPTQPYSFPLSLKRLQDLPRQIIGRVEAGPSYVRALEQDGRVGLVRLTDTGDGTLAVEIRGDLEPSAVLAAIRRAFSLDLDLASFQRHMEAADPVIAGIARKYSGARPIGAFDLFESLVFSIIAQQITMSFAFTLKESLVELAGRTFEGYPAFPSPASVAKLDYSDLTARKYTGKKAEYIIDIARAIVAGQLDLEAAVARPFDEAVRTLTALRGVGRWTAECLLMDAGAPDAFPAGDIGIRNAVQRFYGLDHQPTEAEVREIGKPWAPFGALTSFYLWLGLLDKG